MYATDPAMAKEWASHTDQSTLPDKAKKKRRKKLAKEILKGGS